MAAEKSSLISRYKLSCMRIGFYVVITIFLFSFSSDKNSSFLEKNGFKLIPSGTTTINGNSVSLHSYYMCETEITNREYNEFLKALRKSGNEADYLKAKIDSTGWHEAIHFDNTYAEEYHLQGWEDYPVVNISHEGAEMFCKWLSYNFSKHGRKIEVRLPNQFEWEYAAKGGNANAEYPWQGSDIKNRKNNYFCNYNSPDDGQCTATAAVRSYLPNGYGLYNMSGNAAEMLNDAGNTKGGSWNSDALHMKINAPDEYKGIVSPSPYIGFRPIAFITK